ncbi:MAG: 50S ribosomal protein L27 [Candidatus Omnitrophica bacterium]|nr:50S ribosomal protein L27 [Candidatus Omnitrophota bacterium]MCG2706507.1 50S ribosomal protein L27 [Candidatus Omnitrophota bacterium]
MVGHKSRPRKDKSLKISAGQQVEAGQILARGLDVYKAGKNVFGINTLNSACEGRVYFSKKKTPGGRVRTFINILPISK